MKHLYLPIILFFLTVLEGVGTDILPNFILESNLFLVPHWALIFLILIEIFYDFERTYFSLIYSVLFGLMIDIVYTDVLGVYMFSYAISIYMVHILKRLFKENFFTALSLGFISITIADLMIHTIYYTIGKTTLDWDIYLYHRLIPTVLANLIFLILLYPLFKNRLIKWREAQRLFI